MVQFANPPTLHHQRTAMDSRKLSHTPGNHYNGIHSHILGRVCHAMEQLDTWPTQVIAMCDEQKITGNHNKKMYLSNVSLCFANAMNAWMRELEVFCTRKCMMDMGTNTVLNEVKSSY